MPERGSRETAGWDCYAKEKVIIPKGTTGIIPIRFAITLSQGTYMRMAETSTWAITQPGYFLRVGVIDPDYQGEVTALITFIVPEDEGVIEKGDRVAQLIGELFRADPFNCIFNLPSSGRGKSAGLKQSGNKEEQESEQQERNTGNKDEGGLEHH